MAITGGLPEMWARRPVFIERKYFASASKVFFSDWAKGPKNPYEMSTPRNVPTSAPPMRWPSTSGGCEIEPIV